MRKWLLLAVAAGAASGLVYCSAANPTFGSIVLSLVISLPLFLSGLGIGLAGGLVAAAVGLVLVGIFAGPAHALIYALVHALPAVGLCRQALLSRVKPDGNVEWYPGGLLLTWLIGFAGLLYVLTLAYFELFEEGLSAAIRADTQQIIEAFGDTLKPEEAKMALEAAPYVFPGVTACYYIVVTLANGALAQHILRRSGRNLRPSIAFADLTLPRQLLYVFAASIVVALLSSALGPIAYTLAMILALAYFLLGLAVVHAFLRARANAGMALFSFYVMLILLMVMAPKVGVAVVGLGIVEQLVGIRRRFTAGPGKENE